MDQNQNTNYVNAFVDVTVGQLHEVMGKSLHLQTQLKLAEGIIELLNKQINEIKSLYQETMAQHQVEQSKQLGEREQEYIKQLESKDSEIHALKTKMANLDGLLEQVRSMKKIIAVKNAEIEGLKTPKKRGKKKTEPVENITIPEITLTEMIPVGNKEENNSTF